MSFDTFAKIRAIISQATDPESGPPSLSNVLTICAAAFLGGGVAALGASLWMIAAAALSLGMVLVAILFFLAWKATRVNTSMLRGARYFTSADSEYLRTLHRSGDIDLLHDFIASESVAVILLRGAEGVGKSSVVHCLESSFVAPDDRKFVFADASQTDFELNLLRDYGNSFKDPEFLKLPQTLDSLFASNPERKEVIVVENADLVEDRDRLRALMSLALDKALYQRVLIVITSNEDFKNNWSAIEWPRPQAFRKPQIKRFKKEEARDVARLIISKARLSISSKLIRELTDDIADEADADVSPLCLSVLLQRMGKSGGRRYSLSRYHSSGYATGLMGEYIREHLSDYSRDLLVALSRQANPVAREFLPVELGVSQISVSELTSILEFLSEPEIRIVRPNHDRTRFRVVEDWRPAFQAFGGSVDSDVAVLENHLIGKYRWWREGRALIRRWPLKLLDKGKGLLTRSELKSLRGKATGSPLVADADVSEYIESSRKFRRAQFLWIAGSATICIAAIGIGLYYLQGWEAKIYTRNWGLPKDFLDYDKQIKGLSVVCAVNDLRWLPRGLTNLDANCEGIRSLRGVPPGLKRLGLGYTKVKSLAGLPTSLTDLDIKWSKISSLEGLRGQSLENLEKLDVSNIPVPDMNIIPRSVKVLVLQGPSTGSLDHLPEGLRDLTVSGTVITHLAGLPSSIERLTLWQNSLLTIDYLPPRLTYLDISPTLLPDLLPKCLESLRFTSDVLPPLIVKVKVPTGVPSLEFTNTGVKDENLPDELDSLKFNDVSSASTWPLDRLPKKLRHLKMPWKGDASFNLLPNSLIDLDLSGSDTLFSLAKLDQVPGLKVDVLNVSSTKIPDLEMVPESVTVLRFESCTSGALKKFPTKLTKLFLAGCQYLKTIENLPGTLEELDVSGTPITTLSNLPPNLVKLNISNTEIGSLPVLPNHLQELVLHMNQIETLKGLPPSVTKLSFVGRATRLK